VFVVGEQDYERIRPYDAVSSGAPVFLVPAFTRKKLLAVTIAQHDKSVIRLEMAVVGATGDSAAAAKWLQALETLDVSGMHQSKVKLDELLVGHQQLCHELVVHVPRQVGLFTWLADHQRIVFVKARLVHRAAQRLTDESTVLVVEPARADQSIHVLRVYTAGAGSGVSARPAAGHGLPSAVAGSLSAQDRKLAHAAPVAAAPANPIVAQSERGAVSYNFLRTFRGAHRTKLFALAEMVDNARDAGARRLDVFALEGLGGLALIDNGQGMANDEFSRFLNHFGYPAKALLSTAVGGFGQGFKKAVVQLARFCVVLTRRAHKPLLCGVFAFPANRERSEELVSNPVCAIDGLGTVLSAHGLSGRSGLQQALNTARARLEGTDAAGTALILVDLLPGLVLDPTALDVRLETAIAMDKAQFMSLRQFCKWLYLRPSMTIFIEGMAVGTILCTSRLQRSITYTVADIPLVDRRELASAAVDRWELAAADWRTWGRLRHICAQFQVHGGSAARGRGPEAVRPAAVLPQPLGGVLPHCGA
jgi:hypothetical protein